jgi:hypothetical protein
VPLERKRWASRVVVSVLDPSTADEREPIRVNDEGEIRSAPVDVAIQGVSISNR